jgi:DNA-binding LytR/AlgR family response regulator
MKPITALIAEDEPLLAESLQRELARAWPELCMVATVGDGESAVAQALALKPDVLFLDIQMPVMTGLEAAAQLANSLPSPQPLPLLVFVTAYDQYAVQAFENQAMDYLLKPVRAERLAQTVLRLKQRLAKRNEAAQAQIMPGNARISSANADAHANANALAITGFDETAAQLRQLLQAVMPVQPRLSTIQASQGNSIHLLPIADVVYFEAADKYVRVLTADKEYLIRTPIKDLLPQLDTAVFWQIHRGTLVRAQSIAAVHRDEHYKLSIQLRERPERLAVSRLYAHLFRAM